MSAEKKPTFFNNILDEAKSISKKIVSETGKTYQSFKTNMNIVNLKKRRRERFADLGQKTFNLIKKGTLTVPGVEYLVSELKALEFQISLKEEDLADFAAAEAKPKEPKESKQAGLPHLDDSTMNATIQPLKSEKKEQSAPRTEIKTIKLDPLNDGVKTEQKPGKKDTSQTEMPKKATSIPKKTSSAKSTAVNSFSSLKGIGEKLAYKFIAAGYDTPEKLANADPKELAKLLERTEKTALKFIAIAKSALPKK